MTRFSFAIVAHLLVRTRWLCNYSAACRRNWQQPDIVITPAAKSAADRSE
jgi:hypothetical protein